MPNATQPLVCFGDFELNLQSGELQRNGHRRRLPQQSFCVLTILLNSPGEVVTREELRKELWPEDTFVDFEHGVNSAVRRLREALNDSADEPRFIETLPRLGYRYLGPPPTNRPRHAQEKQQTARDNPALDAQSVKPRRKSFIVLAGACAALTLLVALILWRRLPREPRVTRVIRLTNDARVRSPIRLPVTDGLHLYFVEGATTYSGSGIGQVSALGGETTELKTALTEPSAIFSISPDFMELLAGNGLSARIDPATGRPRNMSEVWAQPLPAGTPHRIGNIYASAACYTPDGTQILYADGQSLFTINRDGSNPRELAKIPPELTKVRGADGLLGAVGGLRYSPDGKRIRFHIGGWASSSSLWEIEANGSNLHALLPKWREASFQCCGNWSSDGNYYFFQARQGDDQAIWVVPEHRYLLAGGIGEPARLISGPLRLSAPVPSIDGKKLFVVGQELRLEPIRYDSKTRRFESYLNGISTNVFEFSPDHKWIAYVSYPDMNLWRSRVDGTEKTQLTLPPVRAFLPHWSPDGSKIAFMDVQFGRPWTVSLISSSGGPLQSFQGGDPNWTPDGKSVVYGTLSKPGAKPRFAGIFRLDLDSGKTSTIPSSEGRYSSRVSPDGRYIVAFSETATELMLFDSKTQKWSTLAKSELLAFNLWSPDGKYVYVRDNPGSPRIVRVRVPDGRIEEVVSLKGFPQLGEPYVGWFGLTPEGDPILIRDRSTQEIYALDLDWP